MVPPAPESAGILFHSPFPANCCRPKYRANVSLAKDCVASASGLQNSQRPRAMIPPDRRIVRASLGPRLAPPEIRGCHEANCAPRQLASSYLRMGHIPRLAVLANLLPAVRQPFEPQSNSLPGAPGSIRVAAGSAVQAAQGVLCIR